MKYSERDSKEYWTKTVIIQKRIQHRNCIIKPYTLLFHWHADAYESYDNQSEYLTSKVLPSYLFLCITISSTGQVVAEIIWLIFPTYLKQKYHFPFQPEQLMLGTRT
jgi:hypothetical protein